MKIAVEGRPDEESCGLYRCWPKMIVIMVCALSLRDCSVSVVD